MTRRIAAALAHRHQRLPGAVEDAHDAVSRIDEKDLAVPRVDAARTVERQVGAANVEPMPAVEVESLHAVIPTVDDVEELVVGHRVERFVKLSGPGAAPAPLGQVGTVARELLHPVAEPLADVDVPLSIDGNAHRFAELGRPCPCPAGERIGGAAGSG